MNIQPLAIRVFATIQSALAVHLADSDALTPNAATPADRGQATAEYSLVILGAAAVALMVITWATKTDKVTSLLNKVVDKIINQVA